jgi:D-glycero-D-manno-heptose 1,7-bisphosphate phosphatase
MTGKAAVFLDRDGVLNEASVRNGSPHPPLRPDQLRILPGVADACARLRARGFVLPVVTNQPDVARGALDLVTLERIHARLQEHLPIDSVWVCPHDDADRCDCRKPAPGLIHRAARHHQVDLRRSFMVGDRWRDIEAGQQAGCRTVLVVNDTYREKRAVGADIEVRDLLEAAAWIMAATPVPKEVDVG